jgi:hypothetical protein
MANTAIIVEHGVGAGNGAGLINEMGPWPPRHGHQPGASNEDEPDQEIANSPDATGPPEIIQLNPIG